MNLATTRTLQLVSTSCYSLWKTLVVVNAFHEQTQYNVQLFFVCVLVLPYCCLFYRCYVNAYLNSIFFSDCISFYIYQSITQIVVAYVCFAVLSRHHLAQHRHLTTITSQLQTNFRIAPSIIYKRRCQLEGLFTKYPNTIQLREYGRCKRRYRTVDEGLLSR